MPRSFTTIRFALGSVICAAAGFALLSGSASAQCVTPWPAPAPWPTQVQFVPTHPMPGEPIQMQLGPITSIKIVGNTVTRIGQDIVVSGSTLIFGGVPPPPSIVTIDLGGFPAGNYQVRLRFLQDGSACPEMTFPLLVGAATPLPVPGLGDRPWQLGLGAGLLLAAGWAGRHRRRATRS